MKNSYFFWLPGSSHFPSLGSSAPPHTKIIDLTGLYPAEPSSFLSPSLRGAPSLADPLLRARYERTAKKKGKRAWDVALYDAMREQKQLAKSKGAR